MLADPRVERGCALLGPPAVPSRILVMEGGQIIEDGSPTKVRSRAALLCGLSQQ